MRAAELRDFPGIRVIRIEHHGDVCVIPTTQAGTQHAVIGVQMKRKVTPRSLGVDGRAMGSHSVVQIF